MKEKDNGERLRSENKRLRRENEYLRHRLTALGEKLSDGDEIPFEERLGVASRMASATRKRTYFGYLMNRIRGSVLFRLWDRTRFAVRGFFWASRVWRLLASIFVLFGVSTQFVLIVGAMVILLPAALVGSLFIGGMSFFAHRRWNKALSVKLASEKKIYIVFAPKTWEKHEYFQYFVSEMEKDGMVFLVLASFAACGYQGLSPLSDKRYAVHISYYFSLKKHIEGRIVQIS